MDAGDLAIRNITYRAFVELGRAPGVDEVAERAAAPPDDVASAWGRLHDAHALVLDHVTGGLLMANPFSAVPTVHRVEAAGRWWHANCAWDAFGICAALHADGHVETVCRDCGEPLVIDVQDQRPDDPSLLFHCLVPAAQWWDDIAFT